MIKERGNAGLLISQDLRVHCSYVHYSRPNQSLKLGWGSGVLHEAIACNEIRSKVYICALQSFCHVSDLNFVPEDPFT